MEMWISFAIWRGQPREYQLTRDGPVGVILEMVLLSSIKGGLVAQCLLVAVWAAYGSVTLASNILSALQFTNI